MGVTIIGQSVFKVTIGDYRLEVTTVKHRRISLRSLNKDIRFIN